MVSDLVGFVESVLGRSPAGRSVRIPDPASDNVIEAAALWTRDGARPRWDNLLAAVVDHLDGSDWAARAEAWRIQLLIGRDGANLRVLDRGVAPEVRDRHFRSREEAATSLHGARDRLFAPETLSRLRGELPLDFDPTIGAVGYTFAERHRGLLGDALIAAITDATRAMGISLAEHARASNRPRSGERRFERQMIGHVTRVAVAFLGARVLEDKGFWPDRKRATNDPVTLIEDVTSRTNGFFREARDESLAALRGQHAALQKVAQHLGGRSFALVDDQDIGDLYERALSALPDHVAQEDEFRDLQQHYTPVAVARRLLERLPLERIPVEARRVFDPAAGSGSLLLAATRRLSEMHDAPTEPADRAAWLRSHVVGNDLDPRARMITSLRYMLVRESLGETFSFETPARFDAKDYRVLSFEDVTATCGERPRVLVANPPYAEEREADTAQDVQVAARFVERALSWLREGDQFGLVLPQTFLTQRSHDVGAVRDELTRRADVFECWQLREGIVGTSARQEVCVLLGAIGRSRYSGTVARKVQTGAEVKKVAHTGFLGAAWIGEAVPGRTWDVSHPPLRGANVSSVKVGDLYEVFCGLTPEPGAQPVPTAPPSERFPYFDLAWQPDHTVSLNPANVPPAARYFLRKDVKRDARRHREDFPRLKLVSHNSRNRATRTGLTVFFDREGYWPNHNVHCIVVRRDPDLVTAPNGWADLTEEERLLWLFAILRSRIGRDYIERARSARHTRRETSLEIKLPREVSRSVIASVRAWERSPERHAKHLADINVELERAYGATPAALTLHGRDPQLDLWLAEQRRPTRTVRGHVARVEADGRVHLHLTGVVGGAGAVLPLPQDMPGWALAGLWFEADLSDDVRDIATLTQRPWALRAFRHPTLSALGALASSVLPMEHAPSLLPADVLEEIRALRSLEDEHELTLAERTRLEQLFAALDAHHESSPDVIESRRREQLRDQQLERLLAVARGSVLEGTR